MPTFNAGLGTSATSLSEVTPNRTAGCRGRSSKTLSRTIEIVFGDDGSNCDVTTVDSGANGSHGSLEILDLPAGTYYVVRSVVCDFSVTRVGTTLGATAAVVCSIGTVVTATDNATLTSTEADILASQAISLVSGTVAVSAVTTTAVAVDARSAAKNLYLNFAVPDAGTTVDGNDALRLSGKVWVTIEAIGAT